MRFIHIADVHASRERFEQVGKALDRLIEYCSENKVDFVCIAGDFWDSTITNSAASHFTDYVRKLIQLSYLSQIFMIYGTPTHEPTGSLDLFELTGRIHILGTETNPYEPSFEEHTVSGQKIEFVALPEPRLSMVKGENTSSKEDEVSKAFDIFNKSLPEKQNTRICLFHNEVAGLKFQNGMIIPSKKTSLSIKYLGQLDCDYYCGGHIHSPQELGYELKGGYSGSVAPIDFGEGHDAGFVVVEF